MMHYFPSFQLQVREKEQSIQQLKEEIEKEENNCKHKDNLRLCQVSHAFLICSKATNLCIDGGALQTLIAI